MGGRPKVTPDGQRINQILQVLQQVWGHAVCELNHANDYQLLVATILSAQSTDKLINSVTPALFARYPTVADLAASDPAELEQLIHSTGFFRAKARNLRGMAQRVVEVYDGAIPTQMADLVTLPGVARKTANVLLGVVHRIPSGVVVDTHVKRLSQRLGLTEHTDPVKIERDLMRIIPRDRWIDFSHQLIWHGRRICHAKKPLCDECPMAPHCPSAEL